MIYSVLICQDELLAGRMARELELGKVRVDGIFADLSGMKQIAAASEEGLVVFLGGPPFGEDIDILVKQIKSARPDCMIIMLLSEADFNVVRSSLKAGADDVLQLPEETWKLESALEAAIRKNAEVSRPKGGEKLKVNGVGRVLAFYGAKGGSGKTMIAIHLAQALSMKTAKRILLVDLSMQFGGVHNYLDFSEKRSFVDLLPVINELNGNHLDNVIAKAAETGFEVLLGPANPELAESIGEEQLNLILDAARHFFDLTILDLPGELGVASICGLNAADQIFYVVTPDSPSLFTMKAAIETLKKYGLTENKQVSLIVNRVSKKNEIKIDDIRLLTEYPVVAQIRSDFKHIQSFINLGKPFFGGREPGRLPGICRELYGLTEYVTC